MDDCDLAGILVAADQTVVTRAASDPAVIDLDQLQLRHREGPVLEALAGAAPCTAATSEPIPATQDLARQPKLPGYAAHSPTDCWSMAPTVLSTCTPSSRAPTAATTEPRRRSSLRWPGPLSAAVNRRDAQARSDNLEQALLSREVIGQAQGILIERERITAEQAFDILRRASQHLNEKLRDLSRNTSSTPAKTPTPARAADRQM